MLHPKSLRIAVTLADIGSATETARVLNISQPGVTYHVNKLEGVLGAPLFHRGAAGLVPTAEGELLVSRARTILADMERLTRDVRGRAAGLGQTVRITSSCFTNYHWLADVLRVFRSRYGEVHVELDVDPSRRPFEDLDRGAVDLALTTVPPEQSAFIAHELFEDEILAVMHPEHPLAGRSHLEAEDFADQSVAIFDRGRSDLFNLTLAPAGVSPREVTDMPITDTLLELVRAGVAISAMASWVAQPDLEKGTLRGVRIGPDGLHRTWWVVVSGRRRPPSSLTGFLDILRQDCAGAPPHPAGD